jgi:hypothetical protein
VPLLVNRLIHVDQLGLFSLIFVDQLGLPRKKIIHKIRSKSNFFLLVSNKNMFLVFQAYNIFQVILSAYIFYEACVSGWFNGYSWSESAYFNSLSRKSVITKFQNCKNHAESCVSYAIIKNRFFHGNGFNWVQIAEFNQLCVNCLIDGIAISHSIGEIKCKKSI